MNAQPIHILLIEDSEEEPLLGLPRPSLSLRSIGPPSELEGY